MDVSNTTREAAVTLMEKVVNRWSDMGAPVEILAEVALSVGIDLHVRGMGSWSTAEYLRDIADNIEADDH